MKIEESIGRFNIRKTLRFEMRPLGKTAEYLEGHLAADEERAASLNIAKAAIEAEHLTMVRRVFKKLPDPIPANIAAIRSAFYSDPEYATLSGRGANDVMQAILRRCRQNKWPIPKELTDHDGWPTLTVKWHWHCFSKYDPKASDSPVRKWAGKSKAEVEKTSPLLRAPKKRKPNRNYWFDHSPFRIMFGNRSTGMSWYTDDYRLSRTFLLTDGERVIIAIAPRESKFSPYALPEASETEPSYSLYEETAGLAPKLRTVPKELIDFPASRGALYLFELAGRALRGRTNLNALYLRALLSPANFADPVFHLNRGCEFFARKGTDVPKDGKPDHTRLRFAEDKFLVSLRIVVNSQLVATGRRPSAYGDLSQFIANNPTAKFIMVGGLGTQVANATREKRPKDDVPHDARNARYGTIVFRPVAFQDGAVAQDANASGAFLDCGVGAKRAVVSHIEKSPLIACRVSDLRSNISLLAGELAKRAVDEDAYIIFDPKTPKSTLSAVERKFNYIVIRGRDPLAAGGVLRGYQIPDRLFVGDLKKATAAAEHGRALYEKKRLEKEAEERLLVEKRERKAAARAQAEADLAAAQERRRKMEELVNGSKPIALLDPIFSTGKYEFGFRYKTSDNVTHTDTCRADERDEVYQKLRTVKVRPSKVWCDDPAYEADHVRAISAPVPSSSSTTGADIATRLKQLDTLKAQGLITEAEYAAKRATILAEL